MSEEQDIILVDLAPAAGVRGVAAFSVDDLRERSAKAIENAMGTIRGMSAKVMESIKKIKVSERPTKVEVVAGSVVAVKVTDMLGEEVLVVRDESDQKETKSRRSV